MGEIWLPQWERVNLGGPSGSPYKDTDNVKVLWHTWEGTNWQSAESAFSPYPPHVGANFADKRVRQYVPLDEHAYALLNSQSEAEFVIQIELAGFAATTRDMSDDEKAWLAHAVLEPILFFHDVPDLHPLFYDNQDGFTLASARSPIRFNASDWAGYTGHVGHQHAPAPDDHWDPGRLDLDTIIRIARATGHAAKSDGENGMPTPVVRRLVMNPAHNGQGYVLDARGGLNPVGGAPDPHALPADQLPAYWNDGSAMDVVITDWSKPAGFTVDCLGALHPFGGEVKPAGGPYWEHAFVPPAPIA